MYLKSLLGAGAILLLQGWTMGLALDLSGTTPGPFWATLISSTQYVSSYHYTGGAGSPITFLSGDAAVSLGYTRREQSDCVVGNLDREVIGARYGIAMVTNGQPIHVVTRGGVITGEVTSVVINNSSPYFRHNVALYGGDSGGPTFDSSGNLVGTHHFSCGGNCGGDVLLGPLFGFGPPVDTNVVVIVTPPPATSPTAPHIPTWQDVEMFLR